MSLISRLLQIVRLFCNKPYKRDLYSEKETYSHPIATVSCRHIRHYVHILNRILAHFRECLQLYAHLQSRISATMRTFQPVFLLTVENISSCAHTVSMRTLYLCAHYIYAHTVSMRTLYLCAHCIYAHTISASMCTPTVENISYYVHTMSMRKLYQLPCAHH